LPAMLAAGRPDCTGRKRDLRGKWTMPVGTLALHGDLDPSTCY